MVKYLPLDFVRQSLRNGKAVEHWIGHSDGDGYRAIKFLRIDRERNGQVSTTIFESIDAGSPDFLDVYEFSPVDPDMPHGDVNVFEGPEEALDFALKILGVTGERFVSAGSIQDVYADFLWENGLPPA